MKKTITNLLVLSVVMGFVLLPGVSDAQVAKGFAGVSITGKGVKCDVSTNTSNSLEKSIVCYHTFTVQNKSNKKVSLFKDCDSSDYWVSANDAGWLEQDYDGGYCEMRALDDSQSTGNQARFEINGRSSKKFVVGSRARLNMETQPAAPIFLKSNLSYLRIGSELSNISNSNIVNTDSASQWVVISK
jgi:hypothetical protein